MPLKGLFLLLYIFPWVLISISIFNGYLPIFIFTDFPPLLYGLLIQLFILFDKTANLIARPIVIHLMKRLGSLVTWVVIVVLPGLLVYVVWWCGYGERGDVEGIEPGHATDAAGNVHLREEAEEDGEDGED